MSSSMICSETQDLLGSFEIQEPMIEIYLCEEVAMIWFYTVRVVSISQKSLSVKSSLDFEPK